LKKEITIQKVKQKVAELGKRLQGLKDQREGIATRIQQLQLSEQQILQRMVETNGAIVELKVLMDDGKKS